MNKFINFIDIVFGVIDIFYPEDEKEKRRKKRRDRRRGIDPEEQNE